MGADTRDCSMYVDLRVPFLCSTHVLIIGDSHITALMMGLLDPSPQKRFTLADAQQHVWFQRFVR